jgi:hypothetical protein
MVHTAAVAQWIKMWWRGWRSEPLVMVSPLPVEAARARLNEGSTSYLRSVFAYLGGEGGYKIYGRADTDGLSFLAAKSGSRNSWRPGVRGRLEPDGTGSRLVGSLGIPPSVKALSALWFAMMGFFFLFTATSGLIICLAPLGAMFFFVALTAWGMHVGRGEKTYLRSWLVNRLQTAESGIPGYRPWPGVTPP